MYVTCYFNESNLLTPNSNSVRKHVSILVLMLFYFSSITAQKKTDANVVGHVVSDDTHIPFATVSVKGTTLGVSTVRLVQEVSILV